MAIFQFAYVFESQIGLTNAVREAARRAASNPDTAPTFAGGAGTLEGFTRTELCGDLTPQCPGGLLDDNVSAFTGDRLMTGSPDITFCTYPVPGSSGTLNNYQINISVQYRHPLFFALLAFATDALDGNPNGDWDLTASAQMRLEFVDDTDPSFDPVTTVCAS